MVPRPNLGEDSIFHLLPWSTSKLMRTPLRLQRAVRAFMFSIFDFFLFSILFLGFCSEVFGSLNFFKVGVLDKIWMSSFHRI